MEKQNKRCKWKKCQMSNVDTKNQMYVWMDDFCLNLKKTRDV